MARPLFILGQARAGTTALAHVVSTNPAIELYTSGGQAFLLECWELEKSYLGSDAAAASLRAAIHASPRQWCAAKRPWAEEAPQFFCKHFADAVYILCSRHAEDVIESWRRSPLIWRVNGMSRSQLVAEYRRRERLANEFARRLRALHAPVLGWRFDSWLPEPAKMLHALAGRLGVPDEWDTSELWQPGERRLAVGSAARFESREATTV